MLKLLLPERDEGREGCSTKDFLLLLSSSHPPRQSPLFPFSSSALPVALTIPSPLPALKETSCCSAAANELTACDELAERMREQRADGRERGEREKREKKGELVV